MGVDRNTMAAGLGGRFDPSFRLGAVLDECRVLKLHSPSSHTPQ